MSTKRYKRRKRNLKKLTLAILLFFIILPFISLACVYHLPLLTNGCDRITFVKVDTTDTITVSTDVNNILP